MVTIRPDRFKKLVHYVCWRCADDPSKLGAVQLNKALWIADQEAFYKLGEPISKARYVKRRFGPVPSQILPVLESLQQDGILTIREAPHFGRMKREFIVNESASSDFLSPEEVSVVDEARPFVTEEHTASSISLESHDHIWHAAEDGEEIPHYTVFAKPAAITETDREWAKFVLDSER